MIVYLKENPAQTRVWSIPVDFTKEGKKILIASSKFMPKQLGRKVEDVEYDEDLDDYEGMQKLEILAVK